MTRRLEKQNPRGGAGVEVGGRGGGGGGGERPWQTVGHVSTHGLLFATFSEPPFLNAENRDRRNLGILYLVTASSL